VATSAPQAGGHARESVGQLGQAPGGAALRGTLVEEGAGRPEGEVDSRVRRRAQAGVGAGQEKRDGGRVQGVQPDVRAQTGDVAAPVVEGGQEPAGQLGEGGVRAEGGVEPAHPGADVDQPAGAAGEGAGDDVPDPLVGGAR
jgi:hypothetical protein